MQNNANRITSQMINRVRIGVVAVAILAFATLLIFLQEPEDNAAQLDQQIDKTVQILSINDFHGHIDASGSDAGVAVLAGAVNALRNENSATVFVSDGDNIGGSPFLSFSQQDKPTMQALLASGLELSAVGNHEFDKGYADLTDRVLNSEDGFGIEADIYGLGANVYLDETHQTLALRGSTIKVVDGVKIGFIGTVTTETTALANPKGVYFGDEVEAINREADKLKSEGAEAIIALTHNGSDQLDTSVIETENTAFTAIINNPNPLIDAVVSGHTHRGYNFGVTIPGMEHPRSVVQTGSYGQALGQINLGFACAQTCEVVTSNSNVLPLKDQGYTPNTDVQAIVDQAKAMASQIGDQEIGHISTDIKRGFSEDQQTGKLSEDRAKESAIGNIVADAQLWATSDFADVAFANPGSLRADLLYNAENNGAITYAQALAVQPFGNDMMVTTVKGSLIKEILEQQWQPDGASRPFLKLAISDGFEYWYDADAPRGNHITRMQFKGVEIGATDTLRVAANSFLALGGDNFTAFAESLNTHDVPVVDSQAFVDYFKHLDNLGITVDPPAVGRAHLN